MMEITYDEFVKLVSETLWESVSNFATKRGFELFMQEDWVVEELKKSYNIGVSSEHDIDLMEIVTQTSTTLCWDYGEKEVYSVLPVRDLKKMKKCTALVERFKNGLFGVSAIDTIATILGEGKTVADAKADFENNVSDIIKCSKEDGVFEPDNLEHVSFVYKYDLPSFLNYFDFFNLSNLAKRIGINPSLLRHYKQGQYVSEKQVKKIEEEIHKLGKELSKIQLVDNPKKIKRNID